MRFFLLTFFYVIFNLRALAGADTYYGFADFGETLDIRLVKMKIAKHETLSKIFDNKNLENKNNHTDFPMLHSAKFIIIIQNNVMKIYIINLISEFRSYICCCDYKSSGQGGIYKVFNNCSETKTAYSVESGKIIRSEQLFIYGDVINITFDNDDLQILTGKTKP